jgi:hypothetical protein
VYLCKFHFPRLFYPCYTAYTYLRTATVRCRDLESTYNWVCVCVRACACACVRACVCVCIFLCSICCWPLRPKNVAENNRINCRVLTGLIIILICRSLHVNWMSLLSECNQNWRGCKIVSMQFLYTRIRENLFSNLHFLHERTRGRKRRSTGIRTFLKLSLGNSEMVDMGHKISAFQAISHYC